MGYLVKTVKDIKRFLIEQQFRSNQRDANCWLFGEWFGKKCNDNSFFFANYIAMNHPQIKLYWIACEDADISKLHQSIHILKYDSEEARDVFKQVGVVIMNQGFVDFSSQGFNFFRGAITVNLWHGVAWKKIGHDKVKKSGIIHVLYERIFDYFEKADKYVSLSSAYSDVLRTAFHAKDDEIIKAGYPRNSLFYSSNWLKTNRDNLIAYLNKTAGIKVSDHTKIILYMPTFRDNPSQMKSLEQLEDDSSFLRWMVDKDIIIIQKAHFVSQQRNEFKSYRDTNRVLTLNDLLPYEALGAADILITDYSSCFFDYLILDRPIIHFIYDYENYKTADRGVYYDKEDVVCGDTPTDFAGLKDSIIKNVDLPSTNSALRKKMRRRYIEYESSDACNIIFETLYGIAKSKFGHVQ